MLPSGYLSKLLRLGVEADDCVHESSVDTDPFMELGGQRRLTPDVGHQAALSNGSTSSMTWVRCSNENNQFGVAQGASYDSRSASHCLLDHAGQSTDSKEPSLESVAEGARRSVHARCAISCCAALQTYILSGSRC